MLWLLQSCLFFMIVYQVMVFSYPITYSEDHGFTKTEIIVLHTQTVVFAVHWFLNNAAHTTYTTYYWILVKKVEAQIRQKALKNEGLLSRILYGG